MPFGSSRTPRPFATHVRATVKWSNPSKGFGFVTPDDGSQDVFLHVSAVEQAGLQSLDEGSIIVCDLADGQKGARCRPSTASRPALLRRNGAVVRRLDPAIRARASATMMITATLQSQAAANPSKAW